MIVKLLTEHHLEFLSLKRGCRGSSESTLVEMPHCMKSHALAHFTHMSMQMRQQSKCRFQYHPEGLGHRGLLRGLLSNVQTLCLLHIHIKC